MELESSTTGLRRETKANDDGIYRLPELPVGEYTVTFRMEGFQSKAYSVTLAVGQVRTINVELSIAGVTTAVDVVEEIQPLQQNNAEVGIVIDQTQVGATPLNGRNWSAPLAPGATNTGEGSQNTVRFNGRARDENNFTFDGVDATGVSSFNALQISLLRSRRGLQWQTQYMWSHNISDNAGAGDGQTIMISNCRRCDRGDADWDVRHTFANSAIYGLPFGKGRRYVLNNALVNTVFGGWSFSSIATARTGLPFSVTINRSASDLPDGVVSTPGRGAPVQRPEYAFPSANFSNLGTFGTITSVVNANPTGAGGPRQIQLALRFQF